VLLRLCAAFLGLSPSLRFGREQEAADAILADAAAERAAQQDPDDEDAFMMDNEDDIVFQLDFFARRNSVVLADVSK
jgi:hypothetical protein